MKVVCANKVRNKLLFESLTTVTPVPEKTKTMLKNHRVSAEKTVRFLYHVLGKVNPNLAEIIGIEDNFQKDWGINACDLQVYVALIEDHFKISIPNEERAKITSIKTTRDYLLSKIAYA